MADFSPNDIAEMDKHQAEKIKQALRASAQRIDAKLDALQDRLRAAGERLWENSDKPSPNADKSWRGYKLMVADLCN